MNTNKILVVLAIVVIGVLGVIFPKGNSVVKQVFGGVPTLDGVDNPSTSIGGVRTFYVRQSLTATSSTICSIRNPYGTSTLNSFTVAINSGILGANNYSISTSSNTYATSSTVFVLDNTVATGAQDYLAWYPNGTTTSTRTWGAISPATNGELNYFIAPGEYVNVRLATTTGAGALTAYYQGSCSAEFRQI